jgi:ribonuclease HIII
MKKTKPKNLSPANGELFEEHTAGAREPELVAVKGRIGTDESGKGDYFGPLVVAAVWADEAAEEQLGAWGVRDSKKISDKRAIDLAAHIRTHLPHAVVAIGPRKYNELYARIRNLNRLLAWAHARVIENILEEVACDTVIADKFGDEKYIANALMKKGRDVRLIQKVRAEADPVVAAASIVARAEFLDRLSILSNVSGIELRKGASDLVDQIGARIMRSGGEAKLKEVAKWHFKNTRKILSRQSGGQ